MGSPLVPLERASGIAPAGYAHDDIDWGGPAADVVSRANTKVDQPRATTRPTAHQRANDGVVRLASSLHALGVIPLHEAAIIEADGIADLRNLRQPVRCESVAIPTIPIPSSGSTRVGNASSRGPQD